MNISHLNLPKKLLKDRILFLDILKFSSYICTWNEMNANFFFITGKCGRLHFQTHMKESQFKYKTLKKITKVLSQDT